MVIRLFDKVSHNESNFTALQINFTKQKVTKGSCSNCTVSSDCLCQIVGGANGLQLFLDHLLKGKKTYFLSSY